MWIIIAGVIVTSPLLLFYLYNDSNAIAFDNKNSKIIILDRTPPIVIKFTNLVKVDLIINGTKAKSGDIKANQKLVKETDSICLKIIAADIDSPIYVYFKTNQINKTHIENNDIQKAVALYNRLSEVINLSEAPQSSFINFIKLPSSRKIKNLTQSLLSKSV